MLSWFRQLDDLLRGRQTLPERLAEGRVTLPLGRFIPLAVLLGAVYGFFMGWYAILSREPAEYMQLLASTVKLPALFLLTLVVTYPSLYVFSSLAGSHLDAKATLRRGRQANRQRRRGGRGAPVRRGWRRTPEL